MCFSEPAGYSYKLKLPEANTAAQSNSPTPSSPSALLPAYTDSCISTRERAGIRSLGQAGQHLPAVTASNTFPKIKPQSQNLSTKN